MRGLMGAVREGQELPDPVWDDLSSARRAIGEDDKFGVRLPHDKRRKVVIDEARLKKLKGFGEESIECPVQITGRLHLIEADPPNRRVGIRAQDGVDWTCTYPDRLHPLVTHLVERLVRLTGTGRRMTAATGRCQIEDLEAIPEYAQDALFSEPLSVDQLRRDHGIDHPQGLEALVGERPEDDEDEEADARFLAAVLGDVIPPR